MSTPESNISITGNEEGVQVDVDPTCRVTSLRVVSVGNGNSVSIGADCQVNAYIFVADGASVSIGRGSKMVGQLTIHAHEGGSVIIGDECLFSNGIIVRPSDAHKIYDIGSDVRINEVRPINIGHGVWVGEHVSILKGSVIPSHCVVGTRSLVSKVFNEPHCIITGNPARIVRRGIRWAP